MLDPRVERLGELLVNYSLALRPAQVFRIDANAVAAPLIVALHRAALRAGAHPYEHTTLEDFLGILLEDGRDEQVAFVWDVERLEYKRIDAVATIWADTNTRALTRVEPDKLQGRIASRRQLINIFWDRIGAGKAAWVGTRFPTSRVGEISLALGRGAPSIIADILDDSPPARRYRAAVGAASMARYQQGIRSWMVEPCPHRTT